MFLLKKKTISASQIHYHIIQIQCNTDPSSSKIIYIYIYIYIRGVTGGTDQTSGGCSLCYTIPI